MPTLAWKRSAASPPAATPAAPAEAAPGVGASVGRSGLPLDAAFVFVGRRLDLRREVPAKQERHDPIAQLVGRDRARRRAEVEEVLERQAASRVGQRLDDARGLALLHL